MTQISIIVPVFNEADLIVPFYYELKKHLSSDFELLWVNDGSTDSTLVEIEQLAMRDERIKCITLTNNFGQDSAVSAGLDFANGGTIVIMNGDLKHPPSLIPQMLLKLSEGYEVVNAFSSNKANTFTVQRKFLDLYYHLLNKLAPNRNGNDLTSFRAFNATVIKGIHQIKEYNLLLNSFFNWAGYKTTTIHFISAKCSNKAKQYTIAHLINQTNKAIAMFKPEVYKSLFLAGGFITFVSLAGLLYYFTKAFSNVPVNNTFVISILCILFLGGIQLLIKSKHRKAINKQKIIRSPHYIIKDILEQEKSYHNYSV